MTNDILLPTYLVFSKMMNRRKWIIDHNSWDECLSFVEFAYNIVIDSIIHCSPLKVVYGFNPFTRLVLLVIPSNILIHLRLWFCLLFLLIFLCVKQHKKGRFDQNPAQKGED